MAKKALGYLAKQNHSKRDTLDPGSLGSFRKILPNMNSQLEIT